MVVTAVAVVKENRFVLLVQQPTVQLVEHHGFSDVVGLRGQGFHHTLQLLLHGLDAGREEASQPEALALGGGVRGALVEEGVVKEVDPPGIVRD